MSSGKLVIRITSILCVLVSALMLCSCLNLKHINTYATSAEESIQKFTQPGYDFTQHCQDRCRWTAIDSFKISRHLDCPCRDYVRADSVVRVLFKATKDYFSGLSKLSAIQLTSYRIDPLKKALKAEDIKVIQLNKGDIDAYSRLADLLLRSFTDSFRQRKIKEYIRLANPSLQTLLSKLEFIEANNVKELLEFKKERLYEERQALLNVKGLDDFEKWRITTDYYRDLDQINDTQKDISICSKGLKLIGKGHQTIFENLNRISSTDLRSDLIAYTNDLQDLLNEFEKLRRN